MTRKRAWVRYVERKYAAEIRSRRGRVPVDALTATQSEIELVKYDLVRHEGYRIDDPILVYKGRYGKTYVVDGHTRARVRADMGDSTVDAVVLSSREVEIDAELARMAEVAGGGKPVPVEAMPVVDRLGAGSEAWRRRRQELLDLRQRQRRDTPSEKSP